MGGSLSRLGRAHRAGLSWLGDEDIGQEIHGACRVRKWGKSLVIVLPRDLKDFFAVVPRDLIAYRKVGRFVVLKRITAAQLLPVTQEEAKAEASLVGASNGQ